MTKKRSNKQSKKNTPLEELKEILEEGQKVGKDLTEQGRSLTQDGQTLFDLASSLKNIVEIVPTDVTIPKIEDTIEDWRNYVTRARGVRFRFESYGQQYLPSSSGTATISSIDFIDDVTDAVTPYLPTEIHPQLSIAVQSYHDVLGRSADKEKVLHLMTNLRLNESYHDRISAAQQFETAYDALNRPVSGNHDPANTSLIPMREAIETTLDHLGYLRPQRSNLENAEGESKDWRKVTTVASQLQKEGITDSEIQSLARDWVNLKKKDLSPSKTEIIGREEWTKRINKATVFLISFLSSLDPAKLRRD